MVVICLKVRHTGTPKLRFRLGWANTQNNNISSVQTLQQAYKELGLLLHIIGSMFPGENLFYYWYYIYTGVGILTFASLVYIAESEFSPSGKVEKIVNNRQGLLSNWEKLHCNICILRTIMVPANGTWNFPKCFWWGIMTITTVGYDVYPNVCLYVRTVHEFLWTVNKKIPHHTGREFDWLDWTNPYRF